MICKNGYQADVYMGCFLSYDERLSRKSGNTSDRLMSAGSRKTAGNLLLETDEWQDETHKQERVPRIFFEAMETMIQECTTQNSVYYMVTWLNYMVI